MQTNIMNRLTAAHREPPHIARRAAIDRVGDQAKCLHCHRLTTFVLRRTWPPPASCRTVECSHCHASHLEHADGTHELGHQPAGVVCRTR